jgi:hypothetical protein
MKEQDKIARLERAQEGIRSNCGAGLIYFGRKDSREARHE